MGKHSKTPKKRLGKMHKDTQNYSILIVEDNSGDRLLIETYLEDSMLLPKITAAQNFSKAKTLLTDSSNSFDIILLDLSLPDMSGEELISAVVKLSPDTPVVILTGYSDVEFSRKSLFLGIADYLLKDELSPSILYKSIVYSIERKRVFRELEDSQKRYQDLFELSPIPMWVFDDTSLQFLDVNEAAIAHYGYSKKEFLAMTILDIRSKESAKRVLETRSKMTNKTGSKVGIFTHLKKSGEEIIVEIKSNVLIYNGLKAKLVLANDITLNKKYVEAIESQNTKLKEIAWIQSHIVRAPLARLMGLVYLLDHNMEENSIDKEDLLKLISNSASELDDIIREITNKTEQIHIGNLD